MRSASICASALRSTVAAARFRQHASAAASRGQRAFASVVPGRDVAEDSYEFPEDAPAPVLRPQPVDVVNSIVDSVQSDRASAENKHVLAVLVDNEAGVLSKISGLLSARGFNIESLTVSPTHVRDLSRMTIVMKDVPVGKASQALKQLQDVVNVWAVVDYTGTNSLQREVIMVKVSYLPNAGLGGSGSSSGSSSGSGSVPHPPPPPGYRELIAAQPHRAAVRDIGALFGAEVVDVGSRHITYILTSWSRRIDAFVRMLEPWGIIEVARSGVIAMLRSPVTGTYSDAGLRGAGEGKTAAPDASQLPPG